MKRLWRWLFNLAVGVPLMVGGTAMVLLVASFFAPQWINVERLDRTTRTWTRVVISSDSGRIVVSRERRTFDMLYTAEAYQESHYEGEGFGWFGGHAPIQPNFDEVWRGLGLGLFYYRPTRGGSVIASSFMAIIPYWLVAVLSSIPLLRPATRWIRHRRRLQAGLCATCGYDLRASPGRCPECGALPAVPKGTAP